MSKRKIAAGCRLSAMTLAAQIVNLPYRRLAAGRASVWLRSADCQSVSHSRLPVVLWQTSRCLGDCGEQWPFSLTLDPSPAGRGKPPVVADFMCAFIHLAATDFPSSAKRFSLSQRERAGVRENDRCNRTIALQRGLFANRIDFPTTNSTRHYRWSFCTSMPASIKGPTPFKSLFTIGSPM